MCGTIWTPLGSTRVVDELHFLVNVAQHAFGLRAFARLHDTFDRIGIVQQRSIGTPDRLADLSQLDLGAFDDDTYIANAHRGAVLHRDDGLADVLGSLHQAKSANVEGLLSLLDVAAATVGVIGCQGLLHARHRQSVRHQFVGIDLDLVFLRLSAED